MSTSGGGSSGNCLDFLHCNKCFYPLSVIPNDSPHRPFSLTNCWHVICGVCFEKHGAKNNVCCVCSRTSVRTLRLESPMPDNVKRLFHNYVAEWEENQSWAESRRRAQAATLSEVAKALEEIARELTASSSSSSASSKSGEAAVKKTTQTAKFQQEQWRSLARGYGGIWGEYRKSREELKKYQVELQGVRQALKEAEEEMRTLKGKFRELQRRKSGEPSRQQLPHHHQQQSCSRPTSSTPAFFDVSNLDGRSPFFRKVSAPPQRPSSGSGGRENRDQAAPPSSSTGRRRSASPFAHAPTNNRHGAASTNMAKLQTPKIFSDSNEVAAEGLSTSFFVNNVGL